ncbi:hypothetical protein DPMN_175235 [Dreissena polymorpha]|uniref:Uncharacterized protein n=1 Tax=Dreissena polymorpha TaxID=45954 RepID=A0A9D4E7S7_DREPO|nr:hypothetical protein DPMN_175235 [Dreissena polymorpha]
MYESVKSCVKECATYSDYFSYAVGLRKQWKHLTGTNFQMHEQFPPEVLEKRRKLVPHMKDARKEGKRAWIAYDTLYVDGKPVRP